MSNKRQARENKFNQAMAAITDPDDRIAYLKQHPELLPEVDAQQRFAMHGEIVQAQDKQGKIIYLKVDASEYLVTAHEVDPATLTRIQ